MTTVAAPKHVVIAGGGVAARPAVKFGGLATHQARQVAAAVARLAGASDVPDPGEPVLHGHLLVGQRSRRLPPTGEDQGAPLWWPAGKIAGEYLPRWLAEHGLAARAVQSPPRGAVAIRQSLSAMGTEAQYLYDLARQLRTDDPAVAQLGRRMRATTDELSSR